MKEKKEMNACVCCVCQLICSPWHTTEKIEYKTFTQGAEIRKLLLFQDYQSLKLGFLMLNVDLMLLTHARFIVMQIKWVLVFQIVQKQVNCQEMP